MPGKSSVIHATPANQIPHFPDSEKVERLARPKTVIGIGIKQGSFKVTEKKAHGKTVFVTLETN